MPDRPLVVLRTFLGDERVDEICWEAHELGKGLSAEECAAFGECFRLIAWVRTWKEERAARVEVLGEDEVLGEEVGDE
jgi:hypothetical protein